MTALRTILRQLAEALRRLTCAHRWTYSSRRPGRVRCARCTAHRRIP